MPGEPLRLLIVNVEAQLVSLESGVLSMSSEIGCDVDMKGARVHREQAVIEEPMDVPAQHQPSMGVVGAELGVAVEMSSLQDALGGAASEGAPRSLRRQEVLAEPCLPSAHADNLRGEAMIELDDQALGNHLSIDSRLDAVKCEARDSNVQRTYLVRTLADPDPRRVPAMTTKTERLNLRCSEGSLTLLRQAAELQGQDLTSFVMGAALERARTVLAEDRVLRLSPAAVAQIEAALDAEPQPNSQLAALVRVVRGTDPSA